MTDKKMLELLQSDQNDGMNRLIRRYSGFVFAVVRARLEEICDSSEIEDCVTDVFLKFASGLKTFRAEASIKSYLGVIARNAAADCARNRLKVCPLPDEDFIVGPPDADGTGDEAADKCLLDSIFEEIRSMGRPDSEIMFRKYYLGQSSAGIAKAMKMSVSNVDTRAHRAIGKLKTKFGGKN